MKTEDFLKKLIDELELENKEVNENGLLHLTSLKTLALISFLHEHFRVSPSQ